MKAKRIAKKSVVVFGVLVILWLAASWVDVVARNKEPGAENAPWNAFCLLVRAGDRS